MTAPLNVLSGSLSCLWEMSLTAAYVTAVVVLLRLVLKKRAPKQVLCLLWLVVFARLLIPVSLESPLSILPDAEQARIAQELPSRLIGDGQNAPSREAAQEPAQNYVPDHGSARNQPGTPAGPIFQGNMEPGTVSAFPAPAVPGDLTSGAPQAGPRSDFPWQALTAGVWLTGALIMGGYGLFSYLRLRRRLFGAIRAKDGAWEHPYVSSPFILGTFRPKIYLPAGLWGMPRRFTLCHEQAHLRRMDHIVKPVCWAALVLHWFNPAVWIAFILMSRDIEAACDEAVIRQLGPQVKADYSATLLSLATDGRMPAPCPLAFDEGNAKGRIQNVLRYRRPAVWVIVVSAVLALTASVCLLTDPVAARAEDNPGPDAVSSHNPGVTTSQPPEAASTRISYPLPTVPDWAAEVLSGKRKFYSTDLKQQMDLQPLNAAYGYPDSYFDLDYKLALADLDGDGADEVILEPCYIGTPIDESDQNLFNLGYLILHRQGDDVYSYNPSYRSLYQMKADGTFAWSGGTGFWGFASARFSGDGFETDNITWCEATFIGSELYFVDGLAAGMEEFYAALELHNAKPEPVWYRWYEDTGLLSAVVRADQSTYTPKFLGNGMRELYRQASYFYYHLFGESTAGICELDSASYWPSGLYDPTATVVRDGLTYVRATGQFARWADLMAAADALFTRDFWDACNTWDGHELFINVDGDTYFLPASRTAGDYFRADVNPFTPAEQTDTSVTVTLTAGYNRYRAGEDEAQWGQRTGLGCDYTVDYPIRLVKTENGWRFDEFHFGRTDHREYILGHILWQTDPLHAVNGRMDEAVLRQVGSDVFLDWDGVTYQIEPDVNHSTFTGRMYVLDVDGDGQTEVSLVYVNGEGSPVIAVYERTGNGLQRRTFDTSLLLSRYDSYITVERKTEGGLTLTYRSPGDVTSIELSGGVFEGYEWLREGEICAKLDPEFFYVGLASEALLTPPFGTHSFIKLSDGVNDGPYVASAWFQVEYNGSGFTIGELWWEPYAGF